MKCGQNFRFFEILCCDQGETISFFDFLRTKILLVSLTRSTKNNCVVMVTWSPGDNPSHPRHPNIEECHHTSQIDYHSNQAQNLLHF